MGWQSGLRRAFMGLIAACALFAHPARAQESLTIPVTGGAVTGAASGDLESWLGIPYAAPPIGRLRWQPPQAVTAWQVPLKATTLPSSCAQNADLGIFARPGGSEDCLYLNVYRSKSASASNAKLPVFVWIHGGSLWVGQGGDYDPSKMAERGKSVVVTFNYRLGNFGFFAHPAIDREGHDFANYGLLDQQAALNWVQKNIAAFGGDSNNVTIAGESSGGISVMLHIASPASAGKFQYAIAMSGGAVMLRYPAFGAPRPLAAAEETGVAFARAVGCPPDDADCLRALPTKRILDAQTPYLINAVIIDGSVMPLHPADIYRAGSINPVTLIAGNTRDEGRFFVGLAENATGKPMTAADYPTWLERFYGKSLARRVLREYPLDQYDSPSEAYAAANTDSLFACPGHEMGRLLVAKMPLHFYEFSDGTAPSYLAPTTFPLLAAHTYELSYIFPGFRGAADTVAALNPFQENLSDAMIDYFSQVSKISGKNSDWPRFDPMRDNIMSFSPPSPIMKYGIFSQYHHCDFWDVTGLY